MTQHSKISDYEAHSSPTAECELSQSTVVLDDTFIKGSELIEGLHAIAFFESYSERYFDLLEEVQDHLDGTRPLSEARFKSYKNQLSAIQLNMRGRLNVGTLLREQEETSMIRLFDMVDHFFSEPTSIKAENFRNVVSMGKDIFAQFPSVKPLYYNISSLLEQVHNKVSAMIEGTEQLSTEKDVCSFLNTIADIHRKSEKNLKKSTHSIEKYPSHSGIKQVLHEIRQYFSGTLSTMKSIALEEILEGDYQPPRKEDIVLNGKLSRKVLMVFDSLVSLYLDLKNAVQNEENPPQDFLLERKKISNSKHRYNSQMCQNPDFLNAFDRVTLVVDALLEKSQWYTPEELADAQSADFGSKSGRHQRIEKPQKKIRWNFTGRLFMGKNYNESDEFEIPSSDHHDSFSCKKIPLKNAEGSLFVYPDNGGFSNPMRVSFVHQLIQNSQEGDVIVLLEENHFKSIFGGLVLKQEKISSELLHEVFSENVNLPALRKAYPGTTVELMIIDPLDRDPENDCHLENYSAPIRTLFLNVDEASKTYYLK